MNPQHLNGRCAIVTGGGTGIGKGIALALAGAGVKVVLNGRRQEPLDEVALEIGLKGGEALVVAGDVSQEGDVKQLVNAAVTVFGTVDILINNAAVGRSDFVHQLPVEVWDEVMNINLRGAFLTARYILPLMRRQKSGHIINISSESGLEYYQGDVPYGVSKHALNALGEYIQRENQDLGIRVNTICPGMVVTPMTEGSAGLNEDKCLYPDDIAELVMWLLTRRPNIKIGRPVLIQTMENPWE
jgi:3-oxoacyl-[acyl-carrier protein] reductase